MWFPRLLALEQWVEKYTYMYPNVSKLLDKPEIRVLRYTPRYIDYLHLVFDLLAQIRV